VNFTITVKNTGSSASGKFSMQCALDNSPPTIREIQSIIAGGTAEFTVTPILSEGTHTVKILLDTNNEVSEINIENNKATYSFSTIASDLIIRSITWSPMTANTGDNITITAKVENIGLGIASDAIIALTIDGTQTSTVNIAKIDGGATALADFSWTAREGEHNIEVTADTAQTITESNETNNARSRTITFAKQETPAKKTPIVTLNATTGSGLLETWWWIFLVAGGALGLGILYSTIRNMRRK
jgi:subtilase family serine protease